MKTERFFLESNSFVVSPSSYFELILNIYLTTVRLENSPLLSKSGDLLSKASGVGTFFSE